MSNNSEKKGSFPGDLEPGGVEDLPMDGYGRIPHWVFRGVLAGITKKYHVAGALVWMCLCHAQEGHHVEQTRISIREIMRGTGLSRDGVDKALKALIAGGEVRRIGHKAGVKALYEMAQREKADGSRRPA